MRYLATLLGSTMVFLVVGCGNKELAFPYPYPGKALMLTAPAIEHRERIIADYIAAAPIDPETGKPFLVDFIVIELPEIETLDQIDRSQFENHSTIYIGNTPDGSWPTGAYYAGGSGGVSHAGINGTRGSLERLPYLIWHEAGGHACGWKDHVPNTYLSRVVVPIVTNDEQMERLKECFQHD